MILNVIPQSKHIGISEERVISSCTEGSDCAFVLLYFVLIISLLTYVCEFSDKGISEERDTSSRTGGSDRALVFKVSHP